MANVIDAEMLIEHASGFRCEESKPPRTFAS
jgi:hypothetical protein